MQPFFSSGLQDLQQWTRQSLLEKPFSWTQGKLWTETPSSRPLVDIYTELYIIHGHKKKTRFPWERRAENNAVSDITQLFGRVELPTDCPRILVTGECLFFSMIW